MMIMNVIMCVVKFVICVFVVSCTRERMISCRLFSIELLSSFVCRCECGRVGILGGSLKYVVVIVKLLIRNMF